MLCLLGLLTAITVYAYSDGVWRHTPASGHCTTSGAWRLCGAAGQPDAYSYGPMYGGYFAPLLPRYGTQVTLSSGRLMLVDRRVRFGDAAILLAWLTLLLLRLTRMVMTYAA